MNSVLREFILCGLAKPLRRCFFFDHTTAACFNSSSSILIGINDVCTTTTLSEISLGKILFF